MFGSEILDVAIGTIFVFVLVSILCSAIREGIEAWLKTRATYLEHGIRELLHDSNAGGLARHFFEHPLIFSLYRGEYMPRQTSGRWPLALTRGRNLPSYIPSRSFALALMDLAARGPATDEVSSDPLSSVLTLQSVRGSIQNVGNPAVQRVLLTAIDNAQGDLRRALSNIEAWYDSAMDRVAGWYKRSTQWILFGVGLIFAVGLNVNTLTIVDYLYRDQAARAALVARAQAASSDANFPNRTYPAIRAELTALSVPIGWNIGLPRWRISDRDGNVATQAPINWPEAMLGWLITAFAATLGAPFWFDLLNKVMVIRSTVKPHEKSPEEASEDRQLKTERRVPGTEVPSSGAIPQPLLTGAAAQPTDARIAAVAPDALDGCEVEISEMTSDEELPAARGGVA